MTNQSQHSNFLRTIFSKIIILIIFVSISFWAPLSVFSQSRTNAIRLEISKVTKDGNTLLTKPLGNQTFEFDGELNLDDQIRYAWNAVELNLACKDNPRNGCGYLKIYLNDDTTEDNFILDYGWSPLQVDKIASKLTEGPNKLLFVYVDSRNQNDRSTKVAFNFRFKNATTRPQIKIVKPTSGALFGQGIEREIELELNNFQLETNSSNLPNRGKLNIYHNSINPSNILGTISTSTALADGKVKVSFNSKDLDFSKVPDNTDSKLIFALTRTTGEVLEYSSEVSIKSNYQGSLDVGLPKISITEPRKDRSNLNIDGNQKFIVQVDNFEILTEFTPGEVEEGKGYLQIFIDDDPVKTVWPKTDFSLTEISTLDISEGRKTIKVQLVNKNFTTLIPEAFDTIDIVYTPTTNETDSESVSVQSNTWRIVMVILIVVLVIGGIAVLITKG
jgi:hypothetical protein